MHGRMCPAREGARKRIRSKASEADSCQGCKCTRADLSGAIVFVRNILLPLSSLFLLTSQPLIGLPSAFVPLFLDLSKPFLPRLQRMGQTISSDSAAEASADCRSMS